MIKMNENKKQALKMFLDYIFYDDTEENNSQMQKEIDNYLNKELSNQSLLNQFETVANKIDELDDEIKEIKKSLKETNLNRRVADNASVSEITSKNNGTTLKKPKKTKSKKKKKLSETAKKVLNYIPEMTEAEADEYFKRIRSKCEGLNPTQIKKILVRDATAANIAKKLGIKSGTVNNYFVALKKRDDIRFIPVNDAKRAALVYVRIIPEPEQEPVESKDSLDEEYVFDKTYNNPGYELIQDRYIRPKKGKGKHEALKVRAETLYHLNNKIVKDSPVFTNHMYVACYQYLQDQDEVLPSECFDEWIYRLVKGHFDKVLAKYDDYYKSVINPDFKVHNNVLWINGENTNLELSTVKEMLNGIPHGDKEATEKYTRGLIDTYLMCPSKCIRSIIENYDNYKLIVLLKNDESFVENNPRKMKEKGIISG